MGIDNDAVLVYGWVFGYEENPISNLLTSEGLNLDELSTYEMIEMFNDWLSSHYPEFDFGRASPYYDSCETEATYYLTFKDITNPELQHKIINKYRDMTEFPFLKRMGIDTDPLFYALVHVW